MSVADAWQNIRTHIEADLASVKQRAEEDLPKVAAFMESAQGNPVVQALEAATNLKALPEGVSLVVGFINAAEQMLAAKSAAAPAPAEVPAPDAAAPVA